VREKARTVANTLSRALRDAELLGMISIEECEPALVSLRLNLESAEEHASKRLYQWIERVGAEVLHASEHVDIDELTERYFTGEPPFEPSGAKKAEFPDAIALITLERWAERQQTEILVVSADRGWARYAETSTNMFPSDDLATALDAFQRPNAANVITALIDTIRQRDSLGLIAKLHEAVQERGVIDFQIDAASEFLVTSVVPRTTVKEVTLAETTEGPPSVKVVGVSARGATVLIHPRAVVQVDCTVQLAAREQSSREQVDVGRATFALNEEVAFGALVTLTGSVLAGMTVERIEILPRQVTVRVEDLEPDWFRGPHVGDEGVL
jgi:hypothetical protein